jgi:uncharacterized membrane protein HdeD (DUF308 family)
MFFGSISILVNVVAVFLAQLVGINAFTLILALFGCFTGCLSIMMGMSEPRDKIKHIRDWWYS